MPFTTDIRNACKMELNTSWIKYILETDFDFELSDDDCWVLAEKVVIRMEDVIYRKISGFETINMSEVFHEALQENLTSKN